MWELDDRNGEHRSAKERICEHCTNAKSTHITRTADNDLAIVPLTKDAVLESLQEHIEAGRRVFGDLMDNGDPVYIVPECKVSGTVLYVKVKFLGSAGVAKKMLIISAHPPRRWC